MTIENKIRAFAGCCPLAMILCRLSGHAVAAGRAA
jgi:hypothetical protein